MIHEDEINEVEKLVYEVINFAEALAMSIMKDINEHNRVISDHTMVCSSRVIRKLGELETAIDIANGVQ